jgi:hypothetical protein
MKCLVRIEDPPKHWSDTPAGLRLVARNEKEDGVDGENWTVHDAAGKARWRDYAGTTAKGDGIDSVVSHSMEQARLAYGTLCLRIFQGPRGSNANPVTVRRFELARPHEVLVMWRVHPSAAAVHRKALTAHELPRTGGRQSASAGCNKNFSRTHIWRLDRYRL